jgi:hypothetical protein
MKKSLQEIGSEIFLSRGFSEISSKTRKYRVFIHPEKEGLYFIGKKGAIRKGKNISSSYSIGNVNNLIK